MRMLKRGGPRRGQALVELSLIFPMVLLVIVGGIIDFGFSFCNLLSLQELANDGANWAAETGGADGRSQDALETYVRARAPAWWDVVNVNRADLVITRATGTTTNAAKTLRVTLTYKSKIYTPFWQSAAAIAAGNGKVTLAAAALYQIPVKL